MELLGEAEARRKDHDGVTDSCIAVAIVICSAAVCRTSRGSSPFRESHARHGATVTGWNGSRLGNVYCLCLEATLNSDSHHIDHSST